MQILPLRTLAFLCGVSTASISAAATFPYSTDFDTGFTEGTNVAPLIEVNSTAGTTKDSAIVTLAGTDKVLRATLEATGGAGTTTVSANTSDALQFTNAGTDFTLSSQITLNSFTQGGIGATLNLGVGALGSDTSLSTGTNYRLLYVPYGTATGTSSRLLLSEFGTDATPLTATTAGSLTSAGTFVTTGTNNTFTITLQGTYSGTQLNLVGTLRNVDPTTLQETILTVSGFDTVALTGQYFGLRTAINAANSVLTNISADYASLNVIPEPESALLLGLGACGLVARRRRAV